MGHKNPENRRRYVRERYKQRRNEWMTNNGPCQMCGATEDLVVDHINPATKIDSRVWMWGKERRETELKKCQVLCVSCHKIKTAPSIIASNKRRTGLPSPRPTEVVRLTCSECGAVFEKLARKERYAQNQRTIGPFCGPSCRGTAAAKVRWNSSPGDQPRS